MRRAGVVRPDLDQLAADYVEMRAHTKRYTRKLAEEYGVSRATIGRWVNDARRAGLLEPWTPVTAHRRTCPNCGWRCRGPHPEDK